MLIVAKKKGSKHVLSEHFSAGEFQCHCDQCSVTLISLQLVNALQLIRSVIGAPIRISSGFRCPAYNKAIGGSEQSMHQFGMAADITTAKSWFREQMLECAKEVETLGAIGEYYYDGLLDRLHVDVRFRTSGKPVTWVVNK